jgi:lysyl-tRNA synthetase class II
MSSEDEQIQQRQANLAKLSALGVNAYPHRFDRTATISALVGAHSAKSGAELEETRLTATTSGRILGIRSFPSGCSISATWWVSKATCSGPRPTS